MPSISDFTDYRAFLKAYYEERKAENAAFSYEVFARQAGFRTKSFIFKVIRGEKSLSARSTFALARAMSLGRRDTEYFEALVAFNHAETVEERQHHFERLQSLGRGKAVSLRQDQFACFANWYNVVVRELISLTPFAGDYAALARAVSPRITARQARDSVELLQNLGMIERGKDGVYRQTSSSLTTGEHVGTLAVDQFQRHALRLASESIDRHPAEFRDVSSITVGLSPKGVEEVREELARCRKAIAAIARSDSGEDRVYVAGLQLFPVSVKPKVG